jgi:hypothetical protein
MNRIREIDGIYQVLVTPSHRYDTGYELMIGNWTDEYLCNYKVVSFHYLDEALNLAYQQPDINWEKLVLYHKDVYNKLYRIIRNHINKSGLDVEFTPHLMTPDELKNVMFDRVAHNGRRFNLSNNLNDVIGFKIVNPWTRNLVELAERLRGDQYLQIEKVSIKNNKIIKLHGVTDINTPYEIILWPTLISQWATWITNTKVPRSDGINKFNKMMKMQEYMDRETRIR